MAVVYCNFVGCTTQSKHARWWYRRYKRKL